MLRLFTAAAVLAAAGLPGAALAAATFESAVGDVRLIAAGTQKPALVKSAGVRVASGSTVITGVDGMAVLRFDDEQKLMLAPNSQLAIVDYHYRANAASADRAELMLQRGAARVVTGLIPQRNVEMFVFRTPHVNLGVRGTDFTATIIGQSYWSVNEGSVLASTNVGRGVFGKGAYGRSAALDRLAAGVSSAGLPVAVLALFNEINAPKVTAQLGTSPAAGGAMQPATPATAAAAQSGGIGAGGMMAILGALAAALAAGGSGGGDSSTVPTTTHH